MDFFATSFGDYASSINFPGNVPVLGAEASTWFFGNGDGTFAREGVGPDIVSTVFGWGTVVIDYDNDGS